MLINHNPAQGSVNLTDAESFHLETRGKNEILIAKQTNKIPVMVTNTNSSVLDWRQHLPTLQLIGGGCVRCSRNPTHPYGQTGHLLWGRQGHRYPVLHTLQGIGACGCSVPKRSCHALFWMHFRWHTRTPFLPKWLSHLIFILILWKIKYIIKLLYIKNQT
jgi:hypothetical protein